MVRWNLSVFLLFAAGCMLQAQPAAEDMPAAAAPAARVQAHAVLTVAEGKRLIAKAVAELPIVRKALDKGMVIVCKGTTNSYVAEELLGRSVPRGAFVLGKIYPAKGGTRLPTDVVSIPELVFVNGVLDESLSLTEALNRLQPGDVVIKGANSVDRERGLAGVLIGARNGGTTGAIMPYVIARKAHLVIPIGLEKECAGDIEQTAALLREPQESLTAVPSMFLLSGTIVTELEALETLAGVSVFQAAAGGIGGAEGSSWVVFRGTRPQVDRALALVDGIRGEPPFVE